jgi:hypothetical protein
MRRLPVIALSAVVLAAIPTIATAKHSPGNGNGNGKGPKHDLVVGSARFTTPIARVRINAKSGPNGENPRGHFFLAQAGWQLRGSVTCVRVAGDQASVGGRVTKSSGVGGPPVGSGFIQFTEDNGSPGRNDRSHTVFVASPPVACPAPVTPAFVLAKGNYVIKDAS